MQRCCTCEIGSDEVRSLFPSVVNASDCPYAWPFCAQPVYATQVPTVINFTIINGVARAGSIQPEDVWVEPLDAGGALLQTDATFSPVVFPYFGHIALHVAVQHEARRFDGVATIRLSVQVASET